MAGMKYMSVIWLSVAVVICICNVYADDSVRSVSTGAIDATQAASAAASALGFDQTKLMQTGALSVQGVETLVDTTTPFVHTQLNGRRVWRVEFTGVSVDEQDNTNQDGSSAARDFTVLVDSASGIVLKAMARAPHFDPSEIRRASAAFAEEQLSHTSERYVGLPSVAPVVSLSEAFKWSDIPPNLAMEITAEYLVVSFSVGPRKGEHSAWVVNMNGGFSFPPGCYRGGPERACNHYRLVVDAQTGKGLSSTNWPNPPLDQ